MARKPRSSDLMQGAFLFFFLFWFIISFPQMRGSLFAFFLLTAWLHCKVRSVISFHHFSQDPVMWEPHGCGQSRHYLPRSPGWPCRGFVDENAGRSGGGEVGGTGSRQYVKDKSYKYTRTACSSALHISHHHRDIKDQSSHLSSSRHAFLPRAILTLQLRRPVQCRDCG